jgi:multiple sugar transport system substrate-binding protein
VYGVPWFWDSGLLYYRKDLLEKGGFSEPPGTWDELQAMAGKIQKDTATQFGYVFQGARYEGGTVNGLEYIRTSGGDVLEGKKVTVTSPEAVRGLEIARRNITTGVTPASVVSYKEDESAGAFLNGNAVFLRNWAYVYGLLADPEESRIKTDQVGVTQLPVAEQDISRVNVGGGWSFFINEASDKQDEAWKFVEFMAAHEQQKRWSISGSYLPTRPALYEDKDILKTMPVIGQAKDAIRNTTTPPVSPYYADMSLAMSEQFNASLKGDVSPDQAAENLQAKLEDIIQRGG